MLFDIDRQLWPKHSRVVSKRIEIEQIAGQFQGNK